jgi:2-polyprenyl-3-methyl-5-hydroxy-6-metoxy-1,4-benzoquinol methylase
MFIPPGVYGFEIFKDYEDYVDENYIQEEKGRRRTADILLDRIACYGKRGRMLDIGCATSFFLDEARKRGWDVSGIEPSRWAKKYAEEKFGIKIMFPTLEEADFGPETFDVVVMLDVFEHLAKPREMLLIIHRILKKDGLLVVATPDVDSLMSRILQAKWWGINRHHLFYFSKKTIEDIFARTGFHVLEMKSHARIFTCRYWLHRIAAYSPLLRFISKCLIWVPYIRKQNVRIGFNDQIEVYARKALP